MRLANESDAANPVELPVTVLLPPREPSGPATPFAMLGMDFFRHYNVRITLDYPGIGHRDDPVSGRRDVDPFSQCGTVEVF